MQNLLLTCSRRVISIFLIIMGVFAKFAAALTAIPSAVIGGMTTFLFTSVAVSGVSIIARGVPFNRRNRFILTAGLAIGYGATLVPTYFSSVFTYAGPNRALLGFLNAIELVMETGFAVTALVTVILNLALPEEMELEEGQAQAIGTDVDEQRKSASGSGGVARKGSPDGSRDGDKKLA